MNIDTIKNSIINSSGDLEDTTFDDIINLYNISKKPYFYLIIDDNRINKNFPVNLNYDLTHHLVVYNGKEFYDYAKPENLRGEKGDQGIIGTQGDTGNKGDRGIKES